MDSAELRIQTGGTPTVVDLTANVALFTADGGDGLVSVFVPHATAGIAVIETGAGSEEDLLQSLDQILPPRDGVWRHRHGSPGHGRDHVLPAYISPSVTIPVRDGRLQLGTWQSVVLVDTNVDNRERRVILSFLRG